MRSSEGADDDVASGGGGGARMYRRSFGAVAVAAVVGASVGFGSSAWAIAPVSPLAASSCSWPHITRLEPRTTDPAEMQYLDDVRACQDGQGWVVVHNDSDVVWAFLGASRQPFWKVEKTAESELFAGAAKKVYPYTYMAPGEAVRLPKVSGDVEWIIHPELSFMWLAQEKLVDRLESTTLTTVKGVLSDTKMKRAVVDCTVSAWKASAAVGGVVYGVADSETIWKSAFGIGSEAGTCATSWKAAAQAKGRLVFPSYVDSVIVIGEDAKVATQVAGAADDLRQSAGLFRSIVCALPKMPCA